MWSFVIGGSAIFVMTLSGNLIDIGQNTLVLLGITGAVTVGSKLQSHTEAQGGGRVGNGNVPAGGRRAGDRRAGDRGRDPPVLGGPEGAGRQLHGVLPEGHCRRARPRRLRQPHDHQAALRHRRLSPATRYSIQVVAVNGAGAGPALATPLVVATAAAAPLPAGAPGQVVGVTAQRAAEPAAIEVAWTRTAGATGYSVEYRIHDSDALWTTDPALIPALQTRVRLRGLRPNTLYDVRIRGRNGLAADGPPSAITQATSGTRVPLWSDLVVDSDGSEEIDVTRVQMLFFTVAARPLRPHPRGARSARSRRSRTVFLLLMGISNGVYLTAKFVPD